MPARERSAKSPVSRVRGRQTSCSSYGFAFGAVDDPQGLRSRDPGLKYKRRPCGATSGLDVTRCWQLPPALLVKRLLQVAARARNHAQHFGIDCRTGGTLTWRVNRPGAALTPQNGTGERTGDFRENTTSFFTPATVPLAAIFSRRRQRLPLHRREAEATSRSSTDNLLAPGSRVYQDTETAETVDILSGSTLR